MSDEARITVPLCFVLTPEDRARLDAVEHRRNVKGSCTCGRAQMDDLRCDLCKGPVCARELDEEAFFCCACLDASAT